MFVIGGLGGGGDVGGSLAIGLHLIRLGIRPIVASFLLCRVDSIISGEHVTGALVRITPRSYASGRFFEPLIAGLGFETYAICVKESKDDVVKSIEWLVNKRGAKIWFATDLGGDSLVKGDEPLVGSYYTDMLAIAALSEAIESYGLKGFLAVGALGLEGGGKELSQEHLAKNIMELYRSNGYKGYYIPPDNVKWKAVEVFSYLLRRQKSAMLTLYRDALKGFIGRRRYDVAYLHDIVEVKPWHGVLFIFDAKIVCMKSIFCKEARQGWIHSLKKVVKNRRIKELRGKYVPKLDSIIAILMKKPFHLEKIMKKITLT